MSTSKFLTNPTAEEMPTTADVIVIGGGLAGTSAVWALERAQAGIKTVLIEKSERLGAGSSLASLENYRTCWSAQCLMQQMTRSVEVFYNADEYLHEGASQSLALKQRGYLFCAFTPEQTQTYQRDIDLLHSIGSPHIEYLNADEVRYRFGWVGERVIGAKYDPTAGWLDSNALVHSFVKSAPSAQVLLGIKSVNICVENGRIRGVETPNGFIASPNVLIACGASARQVGRTAGVELPIILRPRQSVTTGWRHNPFPDDAPMLISHSPFVHVRPEAQSGAIFGWEYHWHTKHVSPEYGANPDKDAIIDPLYPVSNLKDPRLPSMMLMMLARKFGHNDGEGFADGRYLRGVHHNVGYYVYRDESIAYRVADDGTHRPYESERALMDAHPDVEGLYVSVAHVGHGIMGSPAGGEIIASKILGQPLPHPSFADFGFDVHWAEHDENPL